MKISKILNIKNDIALVLSALTIRIIAPIPGKGKIGIEIPNNNPYTLYMIPLIYSDVFKNTKNKLPILLGTNIYNKISIIDLTDMPHILIAGATGQGKSIGINVMITSLILKKNPYELKFIMIDPKKVELSIYNKIEKYYIAKIKNSKNAIITDIKETENILKYLSIEMNNRYNLLKKYYSKNIIEYNEKFHYTNEKYLPYIVLIIDEFADLIMTNNKNIEFYITKLSQLSRAVGIHIIIATQRPSVNIITGSIKANFPARIAFRVASKIDSKIILDHSGAEQLIGKGDMLFYNGNEIIRLQCPFLNNKDLIKLINSYKEKILSKISIKNFYLPNK